MPRRTCSKGHIYDSAIYGDNCPFCPSTGTGTMVNNNGGGTVDSSAFSGGGTEVNADFGGRTQVNGGTATSGPTIPMGGGNAGGGVAGGTVIRPAGGGTGTSSGKRIVGLLVTYDITPSGQVFNIYEGKNSIGRNSSNNIAIPNDMAVSGEHLLIAYYPENGKFYFESVGLTQNGTYLNDKFFPKGGDELATFDIIRIGSTKLIFIAIPQIQK